VPVVRTPLLTKEGLGVVELTVRKVNDYLQKTDLTTFLKLSNLSSNLNTDLTTFRKLSNLSSKTDLTTFRKLSNLKTKCQQLPGVETLCQYVPR